MTRFAAPESPEPGVAGSPTGLPPSRELILEFAAPRAVTAPLTWSQEGIWRLHRALWPEHHYFNFGRLFAVPPDWSIDAVVTALRSLVERHESFRTTVSRADDGTLHQAVAARGTFRVDHYDVADGLVQGTAERLAYTLKGHPFHDSEWPLRIAIVGSGAAPAYVLFMVSHLAVDRWGMDLACSRFTALLAGDGPLSWPAGGYHPVDQAAREDGTAGRRMADRAERYWRDTLARVPQTQFAWPPIAADDRWCPATELSSRAVALAARTLAARHGVSASSTVLAAVAGLLGVRTGSGVVVLRTFASNRYGADLRGMVGTCVQPALYVLDTRDLTVHELIERSWMASVRSYRYSRYPPARVDEVIRAVGDERGIHLDLFCHFHDSTEPDVPAGTPGDGEASALVETMAESQLRRTVVLGRHQKLLVEVTGRPGERIRLSIAASPRHLPAQDVRTLVAGVEKLLVGAVEGDRPLREAARAAGVVGPADGMLVEIDHCRVDLDAIRELLVAVPGVVGAEVRLDSGPDGPRLSADVAVAGELPPRGAREMHLAALALLPRHPTAMTPQWYRIRAARDGGGTVAAPPEAGLADLPLVEEASGRSFVSGS